MKLSVHNVLVTIVFLGILAALLVVPMAVSRFISRRAYGITELEARVRKLEDRVYGAETDDGLNDADTVNPPLWEESPFCDEG